MKKTIGLLTFQNTTNYGSMLQAFALYYCIKNYEPSCELINYHCPTIEERELPLSLKKCTSLKKFIKWILCYRFSRLKYNKFQNFYTHILKTFQRNILPPILRTQLTSIKHLL